MKNLSVSINYAYEFVTLAEALQTIKARQAVMGHLAQLTMDCAYFIRDYSGQCNFCKFAWMMIMFRRG